MSKWDKPINNLGEQLKKALEKKPEPKKKVQNGKPS
jgi:hypothetical protein